jgi:hypothetical protein
MTEKLSTRVERLEGPDREIDLAISVAINYKDVFEGFDAVWGDGGDEIFVTSHKEYVTRTGAVKRNTGYLDPAQFVPKWTESLDAAMSLVPEGCALQVQQRRSHEYFYAYLRDAKQHEGWSAKNNNLAIALCAAALKARGL